MAISSGFDSNLALTLLGVSMSGGLAYGGYTVFKDKPQPATELLKSKKKVALDKDNPEDKAAWDANWVKYVKTHTTKETPVTVEEPPAASPSPKKGSKKPQTPRKKAVIQKEFAEKDLWGLSDWLSEREKSEAPDSFKNKCEEIRDSKLKGTWSSEYKEFENYCSKDDTSEDEEADEK